MNLPDTTAAECGSCRSQKRWVLHRLHHQGKILSLCTSCVLLSHRPSFCPSCFHLHDVPAAAKDTTNALPPPSKRVQCTNCRSSSHSHCVPHTSLSSTYKCPPCADPKFSFFDVDLKSGAPNRVLDKKMAAALVCAARIASASMKEAAIVAREAAIEQASVAALARKRAREALDNLDRAVRREKARKEASSVEMVSMPVIVNPNAGTKFELADQKPGTVVKVQHHLSSAVGLKHSHSEGLGRFDQKPGSVVKVQHHPSEVSASLSGAVGLRHSHSEGFDRFVAETAGVPRKVQGTGSSINGSNAVKVENHNVQKLPPQNSNGKDYLGTGLSSSINGSNAVKVENHNVKLENDNEQKLPLQNSNGEDYKSSNELYKP